MLKIMRAWDAGKNKVRFVYRDPETNRTKIGEESFEWYFFVKKTDYEENQEMFRLLVSQKKIKRCEQDKEYIRVYIDREHNSDLLNKDNEFVWEYKDHDLFEVKKLFEERNIQTYEADLLVHKRWIIDRGIEFESEFKIVGLDLETDDEKITGQMDPKTCRVLSCAVKDFNTGKEAWLCAKSRKAEDERELLLQIAKVIASFDVLVAFNGCFVRGTKILMANGTEKCIEKLNIEDEVVGFDGSKSITTKVRNVFSHKKYKNVYKISTKRGTIFATEEHPFLVGNNDKFDYVKVPKLKIGDYICNFRNLNIDEEKHEYTLEDYKFSGMMLTDGSLIKHKNQNRMIFYNTNIKYVKWMEYYLKKNGVKYKIYRHQNQPQHKEMNAISFCDKKLMDMLIYFGIPKGNKSKATIVDMRNIYKQDKRRIKMFLIGCWIGDGHKTNPRLLIANCNSQIHYWYKRLFSRLGNYGYSEFEKGRSKNFAVKTEYYHVPLSILNNVELKDEYTKTGAICDILNGKTPATIKQLEKFVKNIPDIAYELNFEKINSIEIVEYNDYVFNFETDSHNYVANDFIVHNCNFDFQVLKGRFLLYGIVIDWRKKFLQDHMVIYKKLGPQLPSYSLDYIAKTVVGRGKIEHDEKIFQMFLNNRPLLREYNLEDVRLMYDIEQKTKFLSVSREVNTIGMCPCDDFFISRKIDNLILRKAYELGHYHFKTKVKEDPGLSNGDDVTFEGAFVFDPVFGLHKKVTVFDFHSLYPSVIQSFNLSTDTILEKDEEYPKENTTTTPVGHRFKKDFIGLIPMLIMDINNKRNKYKKLMKDCQDKNSIEYKTYERLAYVFKFFSLSFYGVMGLKTSRFYDIRIAESTTLGGQFYTKMTAEYLKSKDISLLYGDTDSLFVTSDSDINSDQVIKEINEQCLNVTIERFNCAKSYLSIELDKIFQPLMLMKAKKRYAGYITFLDGKEVPKQLYVKGLEYSRTDSCKLLKTKQKELIQLLLDGKLDESTARKYILELRNYVLYELNNIEEIKIAQKLTKEVEEYKSKTIHLKVVEDLRKNGVQIYIGDKIDYYIASLDKEGKPVPKAARYFDGTFDRLYFWSNKLYPALERVLESVFPKTNWEMFRDFGSAKKMANTKQGRMNLW